MKRLLTAIFAFALIGIVFTSCKKDDETVLDNSITIEGTFTVGDKTYTNPTFDLGLSDQYIGYTYSNTKLLFHNTIGVEIESFDLGNNALLDYSLTINTAVAGAEEISIQANLYIYLDAAKTSNFQLYSDSAKAIVTKVDDVGGYIEGTFEGDFSEPGKKTTPYHVKGKFKVKHIENI